jgi:hypothetical protein
MQQQGGYMKKIPRRQTQERASHKEDKISDNSDIRLSNMVMG